MFNSLFFGFVAFYFLGLFINSIDPWFTGSSIPLILDLLVPKFHWSLIHWFLNSIDPWFIGSSIPLILDLLVPKFPWSLIHWFRNSIDPWFIGSSIPLILDSLVPQFHWSLIYWFLNSIDPWLTGFSIPLILDYIKKNYSSLFPWLASSVLFWFHGCLMFSLVFFHCYCFPSFLVCLFSCFRVLIRCKGLFF